MLRKISDHPYWQRIEVEKREREEWERANPELAAEWNAALREESARAQALREEWEREQADREDSAARRAVLPQKIAELLAFGDLRKTTAIEAVERFCRDAGPRFLILGGGVGAGKSVAAGRAVEIMAPVHHGRANAHWRRATELARLSMFGEAAELEFAKLREIYLLVIDDLGTENAHDGFRPVLDEIIDVRTQSGLPTIATTNLDSAAFKTRYGARIADRLRESGEFVVCGNLSLRQKSKQGATP